VAEGAEMASKKVANPFIAISAFSSQVKGTLRSISQIGRRKA
jgi:hypothetical protein